MKTKIILIFGLMAVFVFQSCLKKEGLSAAEPQIVNAEELITTVKLVLTDSANSANVMTVVFNDPDGSGGNLPTQFDTIKLAPNKTYFVSVLLLDMSKSPVDTISNEVLEEANDHMLFYHHNGVGINTSYLDWDTNVPPLPVGLSTKWQTNGILSSGTSQIILKHQLGTKNGTETPGDTDVDVTFICIVQ